MTITDEQVRRLDLADARAALLEEILATPGVERTPRTVRPAVAMVAAAAAVAAVIAVPALLQHDEPVAGTPIAAEPTAAGPAYRAVLDAPGWRLESLNESDSDGEVGYVNADRDRVSIWWNAAGRYGDYLRDRQDVSAATPVEVLGGTAPSWAYSATDHATMIEPHDGYYL